MATENKEAVHDARRQPSKDTTHTHTHIHHTVHPSKEYMDGFTPPAKASKTKTGAVHYISITYVSLICKGQM